jgi:hypothetical protein
MCDLNWWFRGKIRRLGIGVCYKKTGVCYNCFDENHRTCDLNWWFRGKIRR